MRTRMSGGVRGRGLAAPSYSIVFSMRFTYREDNNNLFFFISDIVLSCVKDTIFKQSASRLL